MILEVPGPPGGVSEGSGEPLGDVLDHLGASRAVLEASWAVLGASWSLSGASWAVLGASWTVLGVATLHNFYVSKFSNSEFKFKSTVFQIRVGTINLLMTICAVWFSLEINFRWKSAKIQKPTKTLRKPMILEALEASGGLPGPLVAK